jgi:hypothetical protein
MSSLARLCCLLAMACLTEMTALALVPGANCDFSRRYVYSCRIFTGVIALVSAVASQIGVPVYIKSGFIYLLVDCRHDLGNFISIATFPYHRLYHFSTKDPPISIAKLAMDPPPGSRKLIRPVRLWRTRKLLELQFITLAVRMYLWYSGAEATSRTTSLSATVHGASSCGYQGFLVD